MQHVVILRLKPEATEAEQAELRRAEVQRVWELTVSGTLRSIHFLSGQERGALLQLETLDRTAAEAAIQSLPMIGAGLLEAEILTLAPFTGLAALFANPQSNEQR
jgi:hypothetical protein